MSANSNAASPSETDGARVIKTVRFRRGRATKACEVCHARKVRCDMTENFPCTNCKAFSLVCVPREGRGKGRKADAAQQEDNAASNNKSYQQYQQKANTPSSDVKPGGAVTAVYPENVSAACSAGESHYALSHDVRLTHSSRFLDSWRGGTNGTGEQPGDEFIVGILKRGFEKVSFPHCDVDEQAAKIQGAFLLPSPELSDHLIELYFKYVHPYIPVVNRSEFMAQYKEDRDKPSLMLRQAMYTVATRISDHPEVTGPNGTTRRAAITFYRRAKALFDIKYDNSIETWICAAIILSLAVENPLYMEHNGYYWVRVAAAQAQGVGMHRKLRHQETSPQQRSRWRVLWWTLYKRDISTAMAFGRPVVINLEDCDVEMISAEDFLESEGPNIEPGSETEINISFFIHSVRLHEILALIMRVQFTVGAERLRRLHLLPDVTQCDRALAEWVNQLPSVLSYSIKDQKRHHFIRAYLYLEYYTGVCLSHRPQVSHLFKVDGWQNFPTWSVAFQAAHMICKILENFKNHNELRKLPGFSVYSCFSALIMMSFQRRVSRHQDDVVMSAVRKGLTSFEEICSELSKTYATSDWMLQLAKELQTEKLSNKLAKSLNMQRGSNKGLKRKLGHEDFTGIALATGPPNSTSPIPPHSAPLPTSLQGDFTLATNSPGAAANNVPASSSSSASATMAQFEQPQAQELLSTQSHQQQQDTSNLIGKQEANLGYTPGPESPSKTMVATSVALPDANNASAPPVQGAESFDPLHTVMTPRQASVAAGDLFPEEIGFFDFPEPTVSSVSSDDSIPDTMNMVDWYDFLNSGLINEQTMEL